MRTILLLLALSLCAFATDKNGAAKQLNTFAPGTGAVSRSVQDKLNEHISVKDYGAKGDGIYDDTAHIQAAFTEAGDYGSVVCPKGDYVVSAPITVGRYVSFEGTSRDGCRIWPTAAFPEVDIAHPTSAVFIGTTYTGVLIPQGPSFKKFSIIFTQPWGSITVPVNPQAPTAGEVSAARPHLKKWRALNFDNCRNILLEDIAIDQAYYAVSALGTYTGAYAPAWDKQSGGKVYRVDFWALGTGFDIDGGLGTWTFEMVSGSPATAFEATRVPLDYEVLAYYLSMDSSTIGYQFGRVDSLFFHGGGGMFGRNMVFKAGADGMPGFAQISDVDFDACGGLYVEVSAQGQAIKVSNSHFSSYPSAACWSGAKALDQLAGGVQITNSALSGSGMTGPLVHLKVAGTSGETHTSFSNCTFSQGSDASIIQQENLAGQLTHVISLSNNKFNRYGAATFTTPAIEILQADAAVVVNAVGNTITPTTASPARFITITTDASHYIAGNLFAGWIASYPAAKTLGRYQPAEPNSMFWHTVQLGSSDRFTLSGTTPALKLLGGSGATDYAEIAYGARVQYFDQVETFGQWRWRGPGYTWALDLDTNGNLSLGGNEYLPNDRKVYWNDTTATPVARPLLWADGSNDFHVGYQAAPNSGNAAMSLYAKGTKLLNLTKSIGGVAAQPQLSPETDGDVWLGTETRRYGAYNGGPVAIYTIGIVPASLKLLGGSGATDYAEIVYGARVQYFDQVETFGQWRWRGPGYTWALNLDTNGNLSLGGNEYLPNDRKVYWNDTTATPVARPLLWADGSNDFHVGYQAAPNSGNGALTLHAKGETLATLRAGPLGMGAAEFAPLLNGYVNLGAAYGGGESGTDPRYFGLAYLGPTRIATLGAGAFPALLSLQAGDAAAKTVTIYAPSTFGANSSYSLYLPNDDGTAGQVLRTDGSGVLSWVTPAALPAGTANYTLRYNGTSNLWEASGLLTNDGTNISVLGGFGADAVRVFKPTNRAVFWTAELSSDGASYYLKDSGPNIVLQFDTSPVRNGFVKGSWLPMAGATYDLGTTGYAWKKLWIGDIDASGKVTSYNGAATAGVGVTPVVAVVNLTAQGATIGTTNLLASAPAGTYRMTYYIQVTSAGAAGSLSFTGGWVTNGVAKTDGTGSAATELLNGKRTEVLNLTTDGTNDITYAVALSGGAGVAYMVSVTLERMN